MNPLAILLCADNIDLNIFNNSTKSLEEVGRKA